MLHDVFICHASEDKDGFVRPLALALREMHVEVWYDEFSLVVGNSLRESIDRGLARSRFGIVVLSPDFFKKRWAQRELNGLTARDMSGDTGIILPVWHNISQNEILLHSPPLADTLGIPTSRGLDYAVKQLLKRIRPEESPLIVARDFLIKKGVVPPVVTDEWWLDIVEIKEGTLKFPDLNNEMRWIFPLPHGFNERGRERGLNIAWTALQMDWVEEVNSGNISQITPPEKIHEFLKKWPGLLECATANAAILALYAPQLTILGNDAGFENEFDLLLDPMNRNAFAPSGYGAASTVDGREPLCGELISWRHKSFGNYTPQELASSFYRAHTYEYCRSPYDAFQCLAWLLSDQSNWLPQKLKDYLLVGFADSHYGWQDARSFQGNDLHEVILDHILNGRKKPFVISKIRDLQLNEVFLNACKTFLTRQDAMIVKERFLEQGFIERLKRAWLRLDAKRKQREMSVKNITTK
jgi:TIR domain